MLSSLTRKCNGPHAKDMGQVYHLQEKRKILNVFSFVLWQWGQNSTHLALNWRHWVSVGDGEGGTILPEHGDWIADGRVCACVCGWRGWHAHVLHLSQLTLRICLRGTSPPRPIHQPGPNSPCATVDTGLTTWHWRRWARPAAEWRLRHRERWIGLWSTFNLNYCKYFHLAENWVHYEVCTLPDEWDWFVSVVHEKRFKSKLFLNKLYPCSSSRGKKKTSSHVGISTHDLFLQSNALGLNRQACQSWAARDELR